MDIGRVTHARDFALAELEKGLSKELLFHDLNHTKEVIESVEIIGRGMNLSIEAIELIKTAAAYHDTGFLVQYAKNEPEGVKFAQKALPRYGFTPEEIDIVSGIIMATQMPQKPKTLSQEIICDADLFHLAGREFFLRTEKLRLELENYGINFTPRKWMEGNVDFLRDHRYFTEYARKNMEIGKAKNLNQVLELLRNSS